MKKIYFLGFLSALISITSCSSDDDSAQSQYQGELLGKWNLTKKQIILSGNGKIEDYTFNSDCDRKSYIEFTPKWQYLNAIYSASDDNPCKLLNNKVEAFDFSLNGNHLHINGLEKPSFIAQVNGDILTLKGSRSDKDNDGKDEIVILSYSKVK
ncbi:hypothetical protein EDL98_10460 [Ornithobacterium rhinotracheale]|uniref:lipocalin family protein n=1 Tax=Ornithobacterium rhinotracheale TaxID=28251 RepID=UPI00129CCD8E|nr:lipocalin family protein [Ornithobacterium rhinotracheale]MRJ09259.1 hypothetical protein [Ornithobacterium rhinotracheale]MRJ11486.1 hypothetical protein [Ornithobacterium rhinotracheale]UOH77207.1 lipocalin family protein [Ornithobacterium rhinotracheale]